MRLKEIKPGMVIHCKNDVEKKALLEEAERLGYVWRDVMCKPTSPPFCAGSTIHFYEKNELCDYKHITWSDGIEGMTEFSDLIVPEMTAEEVLQIISEICTGRSCVDCPIGSGKCVTNSLSDKHRIVEICQQWKSEHEKKEPKVERGFKAFVIGGLDHKEVETEQEATEWCEHYVKEHPKLTCTYIPICRVKAVE